MNTLQDRLQSFIASLDKSVLSFENQCGIAPGTVSKMTEKSRLRTLEKISKQYPQLNMDWLKTGEGQMLNPTTTQHAEDIEVSNSEDTEINTSNSKISKRTDSASSNADLMEIIKDYQRQVQDLTQQVKEKDARIQQLTDKLLGI